MKRQSQMAQIRSSKSRGLLCLFVLFCFVFVYVLTRTNRTYRSSTLYPDSRVQKAPTSERFSLSRLSATKGLEILVTSSYLPNCSNKCIKLLMVNAEPRGRNSLDFSRI